MIQRVTHGVEHGHTHLHDHGHNHKHRIPIASIMIGLSVHAFMEGLPLGFNYRMETTEPALFLAIATHKLPESILVTSILLEATGHSKVKAALGLLGFSLITPIAGILANTLGTSYDTIANIVISLIPIVAGAFIHISTTIFYESGTRHHMLTWKKVTAILIGVALGLLILSFE